MKKEAMEVLRNRRSIRKYKPEQIKQEELDAVLESGTYAPSSKGKQSPVIVAVQDSETIKKLTKLNAAIWGMDTDPYYGAPTIVLIFGPKSNPAYILDGCATITQLMLAAYAVGLGSCWINREKEMFETEEGKAFMKKWGLDSDEYVGIAGFSLGYPDCEHPEAAPRKEGYIIKA